MSTLYLVSAGPGNPELVTPASINALDASTDVVAYGLYLELLGPAVANKHRHELPLGEEIERARLALDLAASGKTVSLVSSGDIGIYAMAAVVLELLDREKHPDTYNPDWDSVDVVSLPGISALQAGSSAAGAILGHDFCTISLSDLLTPWEVIEQRIHAAGQGDFVVAFYNPVSMRRDWQLNSARDILVEYRPESTPVCLGKNLTRDNQSLEFISLGELDAANVDMFTCVMVGNGESRIIETPGGRKMYTPRGYQRKMN